MINMGIVVVERFSTGAVAEATPGGDPWDGIAIRSAAGNTRGAAVPEGPLLEDVHN